MSLTAKPFIFGIPLLVALGTAALLWVLFGGGGGSSVGSSLGFTWNVELTQRDAAGNILYNEKLHNQLTSSGIDAAMTRLIGSADLDGETDAYDQIGFGQQGLQGGGAVGRVHPG